MIFILLPAYNEEKGVPLVINAARGIMRAAGEPCRIVVVDDGSADRTSELVRSLGVGPDLKLITFPKNRGVADVFKEGFRCICEESRDPQEDICVALDSDNTQDPNVMLSLIRRVRAGDDLVIASRFEGDGKMVGCPPVRYLYSIVLSVALRTLIGVPHVKDYSMFYRAYRVSLLKRGFERYGDRLLDGKGFSVMGGCLIKLSNLTTRISEVPLVLRYDLKQGKSGIKILKTMRGYFELIAESLRTDRYRKLPPPNPGG